ncbi:MAG: GntR family transcriptional regulator [Pseudonocardiaceae bacterium]
MPELAPSRRIAADLRRAIRSGEYGPGHQLPSGSVLMARYGVARQTVQNAIDLLRVEGLVVGRSGAGWFVREPPVVQKRLARIRLSRDERSAGRGTFIIDATDGGWTPSVQVSVRRESADERTAAELHITIGDEVLVRERAMSADGQPVQLATSRLPRTLTAGTAIERENTGPGGIYARLEEAGHQLHHFIERVTSRVANDVESSVLQLTPGSPILAITRTAYDTNGTPVEINDMVLAADRYELIYELPAD